MTAGYSPRPLVRELVTRDDKGFPVTGESFPSGGTDPGTVGDSRPSGDSSDILLHRLNLGPLEKLNCSRSSLVEDVRLFGCLPWTRLGRTQNLLLFDGDPE